VFVNAHLDILSLHIPDEPQMFLYKRWTESPVYITPKIVCVIKKHIKRHDDSLVDKLSIMTQI
ncbi:hypothetical protein, partial [Prevotella sp.]|uniref:hypothetical protein n=1 Tax=Prevotella sp. TaxID=59823 RepID=UPI003079AC4E